MELNTECLHLCVTLAGLSIGPLADDSATVPPTPPGRGPRPLPEEPLDGILSPELDKMVTDGKEEAWFILLINNKGSGLLSVQRHANCLNIAGDYCHKC